MILLNPTALTQGLNWAVGAPVLANAGYKVYTFNYGNVTANPNAPIQSIGDIRKSAQDSRPRSTGCSRKRVPHRSS